MELPEAEGTEMMPEFPDHETLSPDVDAGTGLPDDAVTENSSDNPGSPLSGDSGEDTELSPEDDTVEETEETIDAPEEQPDSVSGNDTVTVSGNTVIFPEGFDFSMFSGSDPGEPASLDALIEAETLQTEVICSASVGIMFLLGLIAGILLIHGFRLRRV